MPEHDRTNNGTYEYIDWHTFETVDYDRLMSWKAGSGRISVGVREVTSQNTDKDTEDILLPSGQGVVVDKTMFKLVRKN